MNHNPNSISIPTYVVNLPERVERREHIQLQFLDKPEFDVHFVTAEKNIIGAVGLWNTILKVLETAEVNNFQYILLIEDDHLFTEKYNVEFLSKNIEISIQRQADLLLGGVSSIESGFQVSEHLMCVDHFTGLQFTLIFRQAFKKILRSRFDEKDNADYKLSEICEKIFLIVPFISIQKEFGYSDITEFYNGRPGYITNLYKLAEKKAFFIKDRSFQYRSIFEEVTIESKVLENAEDLGITTFILVNLEHENVRSKVINRKEFLINEDNFNKSNQEKSQIEKLKDIIQLCLNDEDVLAIINSKFYFREMYNEKTLLEKIYKSFLLNADILVLNCNEYEFAIPTSSEMYWINRISGSGIIFLLSKSFSKILQNVEVIDETIDNFLTRVCEDKLVTFPFLASVDYTEPLDPINGYFENRLSKIDRTVCSFFKI